MNEQQTLEVRSEQDLPQHSTPSPATPTMSEDHQSGKRQQKKNTYAPKRGPIIDLEPLLNTEVTVRMVRGRSVVGTLVGYDQLMNVVVADATVTVPGEAGEESKEKLNKVVCIGRSIACFEPMSGYEVIENPGVDLEFVI